MKKTIHTFKKMKQNNEQVTWITAYDYPLAQSAEQAGIDMILVGDSGGMVQMGYKTTNPVTMDEMIHIAKSVSRGAPNTFIVGDMPQGSYEVSDEEAIYNALRFVKEAGCDAVKLEGGSRMYSRVKAITQAGILVVGHLGLTPQSTGTFGGYKVQGKNLESFNELVEDSKSLESAGACILLLEAIPTIPANQVLKNVTIPVYGVGAGCDLDGQLIIMHDLLGFYRSFRPWFAKCYIPGAVKEYNDTISKEDNLKNYGRETRLDGFSIISEIAIKHYVSDVRNRIFPGEEYSYPLKNEELNDLKSSMYWK